MPGAGRQFAASRGNLRLGRLDSQLKGLPRTPRNGKVLLRRGDGRGRCLDLRRRERMFSILDGSLERRAFVLSSRLRG